MGNSLPSLLISLIRPPSSSKDKLSTLPSVIPASMLVSARQLNWPEGSWVEGIEVKELSPTVDRGAGGAAVRQYRLISERGGVLFWQSL